MSDDAVARILEVTQKLAQPHDLQGMLNEVVQAATSVLAAERGALWLYDPERSKLVMKVPAISQPLRAGPGEGLVGDCLNTLELINLKDAHADSRFLGIIDKAMEFRTRSILVVPLLGLDHKPVGVLQVMNKITGSFSSHDEWVAGVLAAQCAVAVQRAQLMEALLLKERLDEEVTLAREIQMSTLPTEMPEVDGYEVHGEFIPTDHTGGDLFDLVILGDKLFVLMGDATGHGFGPALSATQMQAMLRVAFRCGADLNQSFCHVNNQLTEDLPDDRFITAFMGFLDPALHQLKYHSGGQGPILHFKASDHSFNWFRPSTFPMGVLETDDPGEPVTLDFEPGDLLVLLSDGIYEYENRQGVPFGESSVEEILQYHHDLPASELASQLLQATMEHGKGVPQHDDITLVLVKRVNDEN